jgi:hypothetical protein
MIEQVSGNVLINTTINHRAINHIAPTGLDIPFLSFMSIRKEKGVYSSRREISHMNVDEVASKIQEVGITQDTVILVYGSHSLDLVILREFLESGGYLNLLPPDKNCIPMVNILRPNLNDRLPGGKMFPLKLEMLFPIMFPRHSLVGLNHQALPDCRQTRLVCMAYEELCRPIAERGQEWQPDTITHTAQTSILGWVEKRSLTSPIK